MGGESQKWMDGCVVVVAAVFVCSLSMIWGASVQKLRQEHFGCESVRVLLREVALLVCFRHCLVMKCAVMHWICVLGFGLPCLGVIDVTFLTGAPLHD